MTLWLTGCDVIARSGAAAADGRPGRLVEIEGGRRMNLVCSGGGSPTVLLEGGFAATAGAWHKVQPALARTTRVCAYDRAGYGFSDAGPLPRDGAAIARDLDQLVVVAKIPGPFIVVGHSAGGLYGRLFAARRPGDVVGLVLLDPTIERRAPRPEGDGLDGIRRRLKGCLAAAEANPQPPVGDSRWTRCVPANANRDQLAVARRAETWRGQISELDNIFGRTSDQVFRVGRLLRSAPIYVLTASETAATAPADPFNPAQTILERQHQLLAGSFDTGSQRTILSSHMVMLDRPDAVIDAVAEMIRANRVGASPAPLPPSETVPTADTFKLPELEGELFPWQSPGNAPSDPLQPPEADPSLF